MPNSTETRTFGIGVTEDDIFVQSQRLPVLPAPVATSGPIGWLRANLFSSPLNAVLTLVVHRPADPGHSAGDPLPVHRCGVERDRSRRVPGRAGRRGRRLLGVRARAAAVFHLRLLSDPAALARRSVLRHAGVRRRLDAVARCPAARARRDLFLHHHAGLRLCAAQRLAADRPAGGRYLAVGRRARHRRGDHGRNGRVLAVRNHPGARATLRLCRRYACSRSCSSSSCAACR